MQVAGLPLRAWLCRWAVCTSHRRARITSSPGSGIQALCPLAMPRHLQGLCSQSGARSKGLRAATGAAWQEASLVALGHCRKHHVVLGGLSGLKRGFWVFFRVFCCELSCYFRDFHTQLCLASALQMPTFQVCRWVMPEPQPKHALLTPEVPFRPPNCSTCPPCIQRPSGRTTLTPHRLKHLQTPAAACRAMSLPSLRWENTKRKSRKKPQNIQVRKCKVSTEAPFLPSPKGSFSLHPADDVSLPSPFWVLTLRSSGARTPGRARLPDGFFQQRV